MPINLTFRRGTSQELTTQTGSYGEIAIDTTTDSLVVFDGATPGGIRVASEGAVQSSAPSPAYINVATMKTQSVAVGTIVETQGYYSAGDGGHAQYLVQSGVTADGWGDHEMADGNVAVLMYSDRVSPLQWGATGDGVTDDREALRQLGEARVPVRFPHKRVFHVVYDREYPPQYSGGWHPTVINWYTDVDFNHSTIKMSGFDDTTSTNTLYMNFTTDTTWTTHTSGTLFNAVKSGAIEGGLIAGLDGVSGYDNHIIDIATNVDFFIFRDDGIWKRREMFVHTRDGKVTLPTKYPLDPATVTEVKTMPMTGSRTVYENVVFDLTNINHEKGMSQFIRISDCSNVTVQNINVIDSPVIRWTNSPGMAILAVRNTANTVIKDYYSPWAAQATTGDANTGFRNAYILGLSDNINITMDNVDAVGDGYGMVGTDENWGMTWRNSDVNRINSHKPFRNFLKVQDCKIGAHGIKTAAAGDLIVERCTFVGGAGWLGDGRFFSNRPDHGGYADGHLIVRDCVFQAVRDNDATREIIPMFLQEADGVSASGTWGGNAYGFAIPPGSPIQPWNWETQTYDNCILETGTLIIGNWTRGLQWTNETQQLTVRNFKAHNGAKIILETNHAQDVTGRNRSSGWEIYDSINGISFWERPHNFAREVDASAEWYSCRPNKRINVIDSDLDAVYCRPEALTGVLDITIENCRSNDPNAGIVIEPQYRGIYKITDSVIESLDTSTTNGEVKIIAQNNTFVTSPVTGTETTWIESNNNYLQ